MKVINTRLDINVNRSNSNFNANFKKKDIINKISNRIVNKMQAYSLIQVGLK